MKNNFQVIVSTEVMEKVYSLIESNEDPRNAKNLEDSEIIERLHAIELSLNNHNMLIAQNKSLQTELKNVSNELKDLKKKPFFPYALNDGGRADFGEFYLISHAWFSLGVVNLGIIEIELKANNQKRMYLGLAQGKDFNKDVLEIALHGQKLKAE